MLKISPGVLFFLSEHLNVPILKITVFILLYVFLFLPIISLVIVYFFQPDTKIMALQYQLYLQAVTTRYHIYSQHTVHR